MLAAHRQGMDPGRKLLGLACVLAVVAGLWMSLGGSETAGVAATRGAATQPARETIQEDVPGLIVPLRSPERFERTQAQALSDSATVPPEARPVWDFMHALQRRDLVALADLYSLDVRQRIQKKGWSEYFDEVAPFVTHHLGTLDPSAFNYSFSGNAKEGLVKIGRPGHAADPATMRVLCVGDRWLLNER